MEFLSRRVTEMAESETLAMTRIARELKAQGMDVISLSIGEPDFNTPEPIKEFAKQAIDENWSHYSPVPGYPELRKAIVEKLKRDNNLDYTMDQIIVSTGAKQSIANAVMVLVNPGDEVIIPTPYWVSYKEIVKLAEGKSVFVRCGIENNFKVTPEQLEKAITPKTKLIMFSSPSNPTGMLYTKEELEGIAKVLERNPHVFVMADEIYEHINFEGKHQSLAQFSSIKDQVITINGVSKGYAMTGWRIGFMAAQASIAKACDKIQGQITSGTSSISQRAAIKAMEIDPATDNSIHEMRKTFMERRDIMFDLLKEIPNIHVNLPQGAFYFFPDVKYYYGKKYDKYDIKDGNDLCFYLLYEAQVALVPGSAFGDPDCIRLSYATSTDKLIEAVARIKKTLEKLK